MNRYFVRGMLYAVISFSLASYEALTHDPVRLELIAGYALVFAFGVITILTRHKRPDMLAGSLHDGDEP